MNWESLQDFSDNSKAWKKFSKLLMDNAHANEQDKRLINQLIAALEEYEAALKVCAKSDDKKLKKHPLDKKKQTVEEYEAVQNFRSMLSLQAVRRQQMESEFISLFEDILKDHNHTNKHQLTSKIRTEINVLTDTVSFATKIFSHEMKKEDVKNFQTAHVKLTSRIKQLETTRQRRIKWDSIIVGLSIALSLAMLITGIGLMFVPGGWPAGTILAVAGAAGIFTLYGAAKYSNEGKRPTFFVATSPIEKLIKRHTTARDIRTKVHSLFKTPPPLPKAPVKTKHHKSSHKHSTQPKK